jgi:hypothetical protein
MNKLFLVALLSAAALAQASPTFAANTTSSSDNKVVTAGKAVGRGLMWGPKKIGEGMKAMGEKTKKAFHKGK